MNNMIELDSNHININTSIVQPILIDHKIKDAILSKAKVEDFILLRLCDIFQLLGTKKLQDERVGWLESEHTYEDWIYEVDWGEGEIPPDRTKLIVCSTLKEYFGSFRRGYKGFQFSERLTEFFKNRSPTKRMITIIIVTQISLVLLFSIPLLIIYFLLVKWYPIRITYSLSFTKRWEIYKVCISFISIIFLFCAVCSISYFYTWVNNKDIIGADSPTFILGYIALGSLVYIGVYYSICLYDIVQSQPDLEFEDIQQFLKDLQTNPEDHYFEFMGREDMSKYIKINTHVFNFPYMLKQKKSLFLQTFQNCRINKEIIQKNWMSFYFLQYYITPIKLNNLKVVIIYLIGIAQAIIQIVYIMKFVIINNQEYISYYQLWYCVCLVSTLVSYITLYTLCTLARSFYCNSYFSIIQNYQDIIKISHSQGKILPTINYLCVNSSQNWLETRNLFMQAIQHRLFTINLFQILEFLISFAIIFILILDYFGYFGLKNQILNMTEIFIILICNVIYRIFSTFLPTILNFSKINNELQSQSQYIYKIIEELQNLQLYHSVYEQKYEILMKKLAVDFKITIDDNKSYQQVHDKISQIDMNYVKGFEEFTLSEQMVTKFKELYELKRNSSFYKSLVDQKDQNEKLHLAYLSIIINKWIQIKQSIDINTNNSCFKFMGIFPVTYGKTLGLFMLGIPTIATFIFSRVFHK